jgi:hypothetical protein
MFRMSNRTALLCAATATIAACAEPPAGTLRTGGPALNSMFANSEWSEPVHLPAPINSPFRELGANLSPDGLSLYFGSDRTGSVGNTVDIWVTQRDCEECAWGTPFNLTYLNSTRSDGSPVFSRDGHLLFFSSDRAGTVGGDDIWLSARTNTHDDWGWSEPINLGPAVNSSGGDGPGTFLSNDDGTGELYFSRAGDIHRVAIARDGSLLGPIEAIAEVNSSVQDVAPMVRFDGKEMIFWSTRTAGSFGLTDLWVSTRQSGNDPWSAPQNMGLPINTAGPDLTAGLSKDGRTLFFSEGAASRPGGLGLQDIWMSTRTPSGR